MAAMLDYVFFVAYGFRASNGPKEGIILDADAVLGRYSDPLQLLVGEYFLVMASNY